MGFEYREGELRCDGHSLEDIAERFGTPCYVYSGDLLNQALGDFQSAFAKYPTTICYAVKANSNLTLLKRIFQRGFGADVVSVGELEKALVAGCDPKKLVFSGVGKTAAEIVRALDAGILGINVESEEELTLVRDIARARKQRASVSLRVNPNVDAQTIPEIATGLYDTKFGIPEEGVLRLMQEFGGDPSLAFVGLSCHIGSQICSADPFRETARRMATLAVSLKKAGAPLLWIDMGGGLGIRYEAEKPPSVAAYAKILLEEIAPTGLQLVLEPGRRIIGEAGQLLTRVVITKQTPMRRFIVVDAGMNDLIRPSLYEAHHDILPVLESREPKGKVDVVGPVCETADRFAENIELPPLASGDLLTLACAGAYGSSMSSRYNLRPECPEVLVDGSSVTLIRRRAKLTELWELES